MIYRWLFRYFGLATVRANIPLRDENMYYVHRFRVGGDQIVLDPFYFDKARGC